VSFKQPPEAWVIIGPRQITGACSQIRKPIDHGLDAVAKIGSSCCHQAIRQTAEDPSNSGWTGPV